MIKRPVIRYLNTPSAKSRKKTGRFLRSRVMNLDKCLQHSQTQRKMGLQKRRIMRSLKAPLHIIACVKVPDGFQRF